MLLANFSYVRFDIIDISIFLFGITTEGNERDALERRLCVSDVDLIPKASFPLCFEVNRKVHCVIFLIKWQNVAHNNSVKN